jgi:hypothetical protein
VWSTRTGQGQQVRSGPTHASRLVNRHRNDLLEAAIYDSDWFHWGTYRRPGTIVGQFGVAALRRSALSSLRRGSQFVAPQQRPVPVLTRGAGTEWTMPFVRTRTESGGRACWQYSRAPSISLMEAARQLAPNHRRSFMGKLCRTSVSRSAICRLRLLVHRRHPPPGSPEDVAQSQ